MYRWPSLLDIIRVKWNKNYSFPSYSTFLHPLLCEAVKIQILTIKLPLKWKCIKVFSASKRKTYIVLLLLLFLWGRCTEWIQEKGCNFGYSFTFLTRIQGFVFSHWVSVVIPSGFVKFLTVSALLDVTITHSSTDTWPTGRTGETASQENC